MERQISKPNGKAPQWGIQAPGCGKSRPRGAGYRQDPWYERSLSGPWLAVAERPLSENVCDRRPVRLRDCAKNKCCLVPMQLSTSNRHRQCLDRASGVQTQNRSRRNGMSIEGLLSQVAIDVTAHNNAP
jgi:hypothetical protein